MTTPNVELTATRASARRSVKLMGSVVLAALLWVAGLAWAAPPVINSLTPSAATNCPGSSASFTVDATGADWYFWFHVPFDLSTTNAVADGATLSNLTINNVQAANAGYYAVVVTNIDGAATSLPPAMLVVGDFEAPVISGCPANITDVADADQCSKANVTWTAPTAVDNCDGPVTVTCTPPSGSSFNVGTTLVVCSAIDSAGNSNACTFTVTIQDTQPPVIGACPDNIVDSTAPGSCSKAVSWTVPSATDNCAGVTVVCVPAPGSSFPKGDTTVTCTATDGAGNTNSCSFTVTITDTEPPALVCPDITTNSPGNCEAVVVYAPTASDNCPGATVVCTPPSGSTFLAGVTPVTCVATDASGNTNGCSFNVTVNVAAPTITTQPQPQTTPMGNGAVFTVAATGTPPLSYQWQTNGVDVPGATGTTFAISNLSLAMDGTVVRVIVSNCAGSTPSAEALLTVTPISGISFDFDTPGQFTNAPYYLTYNNWINGAFLTPPGVFEVPVGGVGPYPGSGALDLIPNNGSENTSILLPISWDFSLPGKTLYASIMWKCKNPTSNSRSTQFGFVTATNLGINDQTPQAFMSVIVQSTAQPAPTYELRHQRRTSGGGLQESTLTGTTTLIVSNWYKLSVAFTNTRTAGNSNYAVAAWLQDMGPLGTNPGPVLLSFVTTTNNCDIVNFKNVYLAFRNFENTGVDLRDNIYVYTTNGPIFFVQEPKPQTVVQGRRAQFRAYVDGEGPYRYQWQRSDDGGLTFNDIPLAGAWNLILPPARLTDNGAQFRVVVTGPANSITSAPVTLTVTPLELAVESVGSVDGTTVGVLFNQPVDPLTAENPANYSINGVAPTHARVYRTSLGPLGPEGIYVVLTPASVLSGSFTVTVSGVQDLSGGTIGSTNSAVGTVAGLTGVDVNPATAPAGENYSFGPGQFIVKGGGADIWGLADQFRFVYRQVTGDFDLVMKNPYMDAVRAPSKAGLEVRPSLSPFSPQVLAAVNRGPIAAGSGTLRQFTEGTVRHTWNATTVAWGNNTRVYHPDVWLRLRRVGNTFLRYISSNGQNWTFDGQVSPSPVFPETVYVGLAVCSVANNDYCNAQFENVGDFAGYSGAVISIVSQPTNITVAAGSSATIGGLVATVSGGGIPAAGELAYVWQRSDGAGGWTNMPAAGATNNLLALGTVWATDNGAQFRCILKAPGAADVISQVATLTVTDTAAPTVASIGFGTAAVLPAYPVSEVLITFSEPVSEATATDVNNYSVTNALGQRLNVLSASFLGSDPRTVVLKVDGALGSGTCWARISGIQDLQGNILATTVRSFRAFAPSTAPVVVEVYQDIGSATAVSGLTGHEFYQAGTPTFICYSNLFGYNVGIGNSQDNYGVKAYTYFVPPTNGAYKFWIRSDDAGQLWMNTNGPYVRVVAPSSFNSPTAEQPVNAVDGNPATKYLNFDKLNAGFAIALAGGPKVVTQLQFTTANDAPERDPMTFTLEGTMGSPWTGPWTLIASGSTGLETDPGRNMPGPVIPIANSTAYRAYRILFPTVRNAAAANSMQIAEVAFMDAGGVNLALDLGKVLICENTGANANYSVGTTPANSRTNITLIGGQPYYMEFLLKEGSGNDGFSVMWTDPRVTTAPSTTTFIPPANLAYPEGVAPPTPVIMELYTGYQNFLAGYNQLPGLYAATNFPPNNYAVNVVNFKYIAGIPDVLGYQNYFGVQPRTLANTRYDNYLGRAISYFIAPSNGLYKFWVGVDDVAQIWMNTNAVNSTDPAGKVLLGQSAVAYVSTASQLVAQNVPLIGGQKYYLEVLWREGGGGDGIRLAVRSQGDTSTPGTTEVLPLSMLEYPTDLGRAGAVNFTHIASSAPQSADGSTTTVVEGQSLTLVPAGLRGAVPYGGFIWYKNGVKVLENVWTNYTPPLTVADDGAVYTLLITNYFGSATRSLTVHVVSDTTPPTVSRCVGWPHRNGFTIEYSEPVDEATATYLANYQISGGLTIISAQLDRTGRQVSFRTTPQALDTTYTVTINNVKDISSAGNVIAPNTTASFSTWSLGGKGIMVEIWTNIPGSSIIDLTGTPKFQANLPDVVYYTNVFGVGAFAANSTLENYGARITGYFIPTNTGLYRFYVRSDDASQLWMNIDPDPAKSMDPAGRVMLIHMPSANQNINSAMAISPPVFLNEGQRYYMEALMKEGTGGDYFQMTFRPCDANGNAIGPIPVDNSVAENTSVAFFDAVPGNPDAITIVSEPPTDLYVLENDLVTIAWVANVSPQVSLAGLLQWQRSDGMGGFTNIPGATGPSITFTATLPDDGAQFKLNLSYPGLVRQYLTTLHVSPDPNPPEILSVNSLDGKSLVIRFKRKVDPASATDPVNYDLQYQGYMDAATGVMVDDRTVFFSLYEPSYLTEETFHIDGYAINSGAATPVPGDVSGDGHVEFLTPQDIGTPGVDPIYVGSTFTWTNGSLTMKGGGTDVWGTSDGMHMAYRPVTGNFDVKVRIESLVGPNTWSKAGLMVRGSTAGNSRFIDILVTPSLANVPAGQNRYAFQWRDADGASASWAAEPAVSPPYPNAWVRLQRVGSVINGYRSADGTNWVLQGSRDTAAYAGGAYPDTVLVGLFVTAHDNSGPVFATAEFRDLYFPLPPKIDVQPGPTPQVVGIHQTVTFSGMVVSGTGPFNYQWRKDGVPIPGATSDSLTITDTKVADSGVYTVLVGNDGGATVSADCVLVVTNLPPVVAGETTNIVQNTILTLNAADLLANDSDPEGDPLTLIAVSGLPPVSWSANFDDGQVPAGAELYSSAGGGYIAGTDGVNGTGCLKLTDNVGSQAGSFILPELTPGKRVSGFTASFKLRIGNGSAEPADGFSFNFANDLPLSATSPYAAENGAGTGVSFCVDNYRFVPLNVGGAANQPGGGTANTSGLKVNYNNQIIAGVQIPTWNVARWVPVTITLTPDGVLTVFVDGTNVFGNLQLPNYTPKPGRFGLYARTGGQNETHWVDDLSVTVLTADTARDYALGGSRYGTAYIFPTGGVDNSGCLHLTDNVNNQMGALILDSLTPGGAVAAFEASFKLRIGDGSANGADGFSFNLAADLPEPPPYAGYEEGAGTGLSLCVDNYPTGGTDAPSFKLKYGGALLGYILIPKWNSPNWVPINIKLTNGMLDVVVDGTNVVAGLPIPGYTPIAGRFGLYARTGGENQTHWIDDLVITAWSTEGYPGYYVQDFNSGGPGTVSLNAGVITYTPPPNACGTDTFYYIVSDGQLNGMAVDQCVVVIQEATPTPPTIVHCPTDRAISAGANCKGLVPDFRASLLATDNCCCVTVTQDPAPGTEVDLGGPYTVTFTVTDTAGLSAQCAAHLTVVDTTPPEVTCPTSVTLEADATCQGLLGDLRTGVVVNDCSLPVSISQDPPPGSLLPLGANNVTFGVVDAAGNSNFCVVVVTVIDVTKPTITCPPPQPVVLGPDCTGLMPDLTGLAVVADNCGPVVVTQDPPPGTPIAGLVAVPVTLTATDGAGNQESCVTSVTPIDATPPVITDCPTGAEVTRDATTGVALVPDLTGAVVASDTCGGALTITQDPPAGTPFSTCTTNVTITVKDARNNEASCVATVTAKDPPGYALAVRLLQDGSVVVSWPKPCETWVLQEIDDLNKVPAGWTDSNLVPEEVDGRLQVTIQNPTGNKFFRLRKQP